MGLLGGIDTHGPVSSPSTHRFPQGGLRQGPLFDLSVPPLSPQKKSHPNVSSTQWGLEASACLARLVSGLCCHTQQLGSFHRQPAGGRRAWKAELSSCMPLLKMQTQANIHPLCTSKSLNPGPTRLCVASTEGGGIFCREKWDTGISIQCLGHICPENKNKNQN